MLIITRLMVLYPILSILKQKPQKYQIYNEIRFRNVFEYVGGIDREKEK